MRTELTGSGKQSTLVLIVLLLTFLFSDRRVYIMSQEIEDTIKRIQTHKGVVGIIIINNDGIPIKSTMDNTTSVHYACHIHSLVSKAHSVIKEIDSTNDLKFLRVRSKKHEILVAPEHEYCMIVIQKDAN